MPWLLLFFFSSNLGYVLLVCVKNLTRPPTDEPVAMGAPRRTSASSTTHTQAKISRRGANPKNPSKIKDYGGQKVVVAGNVLVINIHDVLITKGMSSEPPVPSGQVKGRFGRTGSRSERKKACSFLPKDGSGTIPRSSWGVIGTIGSPEILKQRRIHERFSLCSL